MRLKALFNEESQESSFLQDSRMISVVLKIAAQLMRYFPSNTFSTGRLSTMRQITNR